MRAAVDLTGKKYDRLTVLHKGVSKVTPSGQKKTTWVCLCDCGKIVTVAYQNLVKGSTRSCGCLKIDNLVTRVRKHGKSTSPEMKTWYDMIYRCTNEKSPLYEYYGERGISVCERWSCNDGFYNFLEDMGDKPEGLVIDRIDVNLGYSKDNCRWVDFSDSSFNTRLQGNNKSGKSGVYFDKSNDKWVAVIEKDKVKYFLGRFDRLEDAIKIREVKELELYGYNKQDKPAQVR